NSNVFVFSWPLVDDFIPFVPFFSVFYVLFIPLLILIFSFYWNSQKNFYKLSFTLFLAVTITSLFHLFIPTLILRPIILESNFFTGLVSWIYSNDLPFNLFPSGHVFYSLLSNLCLYSVDKNKALYLFPVTFLVCISTVFIKQHYLFDVLFSVLLSFLLYFFVYKKLKN
ncbi:phosphatase PAP2 family protein, partial [Candidatus Woesearchaeota archaeon]|nr:phosphatase PAP2 family protein [Candidatus Woesearchaeota archaeon]